MGTLILQNGYSIRTWYKAPRSSVVLAIDEAYALPAGSIWFIEWTPDENEQEESVTIGDPKEDVLKIYRAFEVALAKAYPNRYCPSRDEQYTVQVVDNEVVYVG